jgi:hypothetical protein
MNKLAISVVALTAFGCASTQLPPAQQTETEAAIAAAETVGAKEQPKAELHLKLAKDQLEAAKSLAEDGEEEQASLTLERARTDAELALALAQEVAVREEARTALQRVDQLEAQQ